MHHTNHVAFCSMVRQRAQVGQGSGSASTARACDFFLLVRAVYALCTQGVRTCEQALLHVAQFRFFASVEIAVVTSVAGAFVSRRRCQSPRSRFFSASLRGSFQ